MSDALLLVDDALFDLHVAGSNHPERPARLLAARAGVRASGVRTDAMAAVDATRAQLQRAHEGQYLDAITALDGRSAMLDADTYVGRDSVRAATRAAGGCASLARSLTTSRGSRGLALVRPPGHHAEPDHAMGFCLFNNVAVAAHEAHAAGARRVAIVDVDVHHGNGTQAIFERDPSTLFVSLHQFPFYPGTGSTDEQGVDEGLGATVNVPLSEGAGDAVYDEAMRRVVVPTVRAFAPDLVLVSAGFDAFVGDPLAEMRVTPGGYGRTIGRLARLAEELGVSIGLVLEGGYDLDGLESCLRASLRTLVGATSTDAANDVVSATHRADVERAALAASRFWPVVA
jgi:acetoin utilization deacetylase AcuC-like enzyme